LSLSFKVIFEWDLKKPSWLELEPKDGGGFNLDQDIIQWGGGGLAQITLTDLENEIKYLASLMQFTIASFEHSFHAY